MTTAHAKACNWITEWTIKQSLPTEQGEITPNDEDAAQDQQSVGN